MRLQKPTETREILQTKARKYTPKSGSGPTIWLVGVAHVGRADYYQSLQKLLDAQTLVLYEGVSRKGVDPAAAQKLTKADPKLSSTYQILSDSLGLQFQLNAINYDHSSFRNSDLTWEELSAIEASHPGPKGAAGLSAIGSTLDANSTQGKAIANMMGAMKDDPSSLEAFRIMMVEMLSMPNATDLALSPALGDLLIKTRNAKVLGDIKTELAKKSASESIAVFFGAGHMLDMEQHLVTNYGYAPHEEQWFNALEGDSKNVTSSNGQLMLQMMRAQIKALKDKKPGGS